MEFYREAFRKIRKNKKLSMEVVANKAGIARRTLSYWENGKTTPNKMKVRILANVLNIPVNEISNLKLEHPVSEGKFSDIIESWLALADNSEQERLQRGNELIEKIKLQQNELTQASIVIKAILSSIHNIFYVKDTQSNYITANNAFLKNISLLLNYKVTGKKDSDFFSKKEAEKNTIQDCEVLHTGKPIIKHEDYILGSKKKRWGLISKLPIFDSNGKIAGIVGSIIDITDRKKATQTRELLDVLLKNTQDVISCEDHSGTRSKLLYISDTVKDLCGYPARCFKEDANFWINICVHNDDKERLRKYRSTLNYPKRLTYRIVCPDGNNKWIEATSLVREIDSKKLVYFIERDITDSYHANLEKSLLSEFSNLLPDVIIWIGEINSDSSFNFHYLSDNIELITGYPKKRFIADKFFYSSLINKNDYHVYNDWIKSRKTPTELKYKLTTAFNTQILIKTSISKKEYSDGRTIFLGSNVKLSE